MGSRNDYLEFARRWYWLIALGGIIAILATHFAIQDRAVLYRSTATLQVGRTLEDQSPRQDELNITDRLVTVYGELATRDPILNEVAKSLQLNLTTESLRSRMIVSASSSTQLIDINVIDTDPERAAAIANEVARQIMISSPDPAFDSEEQAFLVDQLSDLQAKIVAAQTDYEEVEASILGMTSAADVYDAELRLEVLRAQIDSWQQTYSALLTQLEPSSTNVVRVISDAQIPTTPLPQRTNMYYGFAVVMGVGLATLLALGLSYFNRAIRSSDDLAVLGNHHSVVDIPSFPSHKTNPLVTLQAADSAAASAYRVLRNVIKLEMEQRSPQPLMVTSSRIGEGKTTTIANLGLALANSGRLVIIVDANFHNPELEEYFGAARTEGFSDLLLGMRPVRDVVQETEHPFLWLVGSGSIPLNYLDVLASDQLDVSIATLLEQADIVLFDAPALDQEQEARLLAKAIRNVIMIAESSRTTAESVEKSVDQLGQVGAVVTAVVVNKVPRPWFQRHFRWPWSRERRLEVRAEARRMRKARDMATIVQQDVTSASAAD